MMLVFHNLWVVLGLFLFVFSFSHSLLLSFCVTFGIDRNRIKDSNQESIPTKELWIRHRQKDPKCLSLFISCVCLLLCYKFTAQARK